MNIYLSNDSPASEEDAQILLLAEQILIIFYNLCESNDASLTKSTPKLLAVLADLMNPNHVKLPVSLVEAAAQCLFIITESNKPALYFFKNETKSCMNLGEIAKGGRFNSWNDNSIIVRLLASSILSNINSKATFDDVNDPKQFILYTCLAAINDGLDYNLRESIQKMNSIQESDSNIIQELTNHLNTLMVCFELAANCLTEDISLDEQEQEQEWIDANDEMEIQDDIDMEMDIDQDQDQVDQVESISNPILTQIYSKTISIIRSILETKSTNDEFSHLLDQVLNRGLGALTNILSTLPKHCFNSLELQKLWPWLFGIATSSPEFNEKIESSIMCLVQLSKLGPITVSEYQLKFIMSWVNSEISCQAIMILGCIALHSDVATNRRIGSLFITLLKNTNIEIVTQVLNSIFDVYADVNFEYDVVFREDDYLNVLKGSVETFKVMVKGVDKRKFREVRERGDEALLNLKAFIKYKADEMKQFL